MAAPESLSLTDDLPFWSAPFGIHLLDIINYKSEMTVLDIGFGFGFPMLELAMRLGNSSQVYGVDPFEEGAHRVRQKIQAAGTFNAQPVTGRAEELPFADSVFDLIVSNNGINNVQNQQTVFNECFRVSKKDCQLVFTLNTDQTFSKFYEVYRSTLREFKLQEYDDKISKHIRKKRVPFSYLQSCLSNSGFVIHSAAEDSFTYRFSSGTAMLNHSFIRMAFLPSWMELLPEALQAGVFNKIEEELNSIASQSGSLAMQVPFVTVDCRKS